MNTLYGIKNCDTVKKARRWLEQNAITYRFHDFRSDGLTRDAIEHWLQTTDWQTLLNQRSTSWRQLTDEQKVDLTEARAIDLMLANPTLIKRPVLDTDQNIMVGFNAENYQAELASLSKP